MTTSGTYAVYKITNNSNGKFYIGVTSRCISVRLKEHIRHAKRKVNQGHFYRAIRKYGPDLFSIEIISTYNSIDEMKKAEIEFISCLKPQYNSTLGGDGTSGHIVSKETRKKMGLVHLGNKYNLGRKWTDEQRKAMSLIKKGCKAPKETEKMKLTRIENIKKSAITRRKIVVCLNDNVKFNSVVEAAAHYNLCKSTISAICNNRRKAAYGLTFKFAEAA